MNDLPPGDSGSELEKSDDSAMAADFYLAVTPAAAAVACLCLCLCLPAGSEEEILDKWATFLDQLSIVQMTWLCVRPSSCTEYLAVRIVGRLARRL